MKNWSKSGANEVGSDAYQRKQALLKETAIPLKGETVFLLEDCAVCKGSGVSKYEPGNAEYPRGACFSCTRGLVPSAAGEAVLRFLQGWREE